MRYTTFTVPAKAELLKPSDDKFKAVASSIKTKHGFDIEPQIDLLYVQSCLVTSGANDNDDLFTREELWKARSTPVLKPTNWQHKDKDILGVIYSVEARTLDGTPIPFDRDETPEQDFELMTEAVVFSLIHPARAQEIEDRSKAGNLFVSMEAWFDDYNYGFMNTQGNLEKVVSRNDDTAFLDPVLRANGGLGQHDGSRVCRGLVNITFAGHGFVDVPANKRSEIFEVKDLEAAASKEVASSDRVVDLLTRLVNQEKESVLMAADANKNETIATEVIASTVNNVLEQREAAQASKQERETLKSEAANLRDENEKLKTQASELEDAKKKVETVAEAAKTVAEEQTQALDEIVTALAGATSDTPPEIASIDSSSGGEGAFQAKIAWIQSSVASLITKAGKADALEAEIAVAAKAVRESEIRQTLANVLEADEVDKFVEIGIAIASDDEYEAWIAEKAFFAEALKGDKAESTSPELQKKKKDEKMVNKENAAEIFAALVQNRRNVEGGVGFHQSESLGIDSGARGPFPDNPRHKIAGSAEIDPQKILENVEAQKTVNFAGATQGSGETDNPFRALAMEVVDGVSEDNDAKEKPGFDPAE